MAPETDYAKLLADMEAKKAALETAITSLRAALASGALGQPASLSSLPASMGSATSAPLDLPVGTFLNKSIPAAIGLYLQAAKRKKTTQEIALALKEDGVESTSRNFEGVVTGSLNRLKDREEVLRFKDGWGWAKYWPAHIRSGVSETNKKPSRSKKKQKASSAKKKVPPKVKPETPREGLEKRIESLLRSDEKKVFLSSEIAEALNTSSLPAVSLALGRMVVKHKAEKMGHGKYRAFVVKLQEMPKAI